jgi:hypothetical protein
MLSTIGMIGTDFGFIAEGIGNPHEWRTETTQVGALCGRHT